MVSLLDDVLIIEKSEANQASYGVRVEIEPFCRQLIEEIKLSIGSRHIIHFDSEDKCSAVQMDEVLLRHVFEQSLI